MTDTTETHPSGVKNEPTHHYRLRVHEVTPETTAAWPNTRVPLLAEDHYLPRPRLITNPGVMDDMARQIVTATDPAEAYRIGLTLFGRERFRIVGVEELYAGDRGLDLLVSLNLHRWERTETLRRLDEALEELVDGVIVDEDYDPTGAHSHRIDMHTEVINAVTEVIAGLLPEGSHLNLYHPATGDMIDYSALQIDLHHPDTRIHAAAYAEIKYLIPYTENTGVAWLRDVAESVLDFADPLL